MSTQPIKGQPNIPHSKGVAQNLGGHKVTRSNDALVQAPQNNPLYKGGPCSFEAKKETSGRSAETKKTAAFGWLIPSRKW